MIVHNNYHVVLCIFRFNTKLLALAGTILDSLVVKICACHVEVLGSIGGRGQGRVVCFFYFCLCVHEIYLAVT